MAKAAIKELRLDKIIMMPCGYPPHKDIRNVWNSKKRYEMTRLLVEGERNISVSDMEIKSQGKSYTAKTLQKLKEENPDIDFFFIVGADSLCYMDEWMEPQIIFQNAKIAAIDREGYSDKRIDDYIAFLKKKYKAEIYRVKMPLERISSSMLRELLDEGRDISKYTGQKIFDYISENFDGHRKDN